MKNYVYVPGLSEVVEGGKKEKGISQRQRGHGFDSNGCG